MSPHRQSWANKQLEKTGRSPEAEAQQRRWPKGSSNKITADGKAASGHWHAWAVCGVNGTRARVRAYYAKILTSGVQRHKL